MATLPTLNDAIKAVIYKKVDNNGVISYLPYFPRTDAEWVSLNESINIHGTSKSANTDMETIIKALNNAIGATNAVASSASTASLQAQITYAIGKINEQTGAFVFKGNLDPSQAAGGVIAPDSNAKPGWVYNVSTPFNITSAGAIQYVQLEKDAQYSAGTNVVIYGSGTSGDPFKFDALAGDMGNHALTSEAVGYLGIASDGEVTWGYVNEGQATHSLGFVALQNQALGNLFIDSNGLHGSHIDNSSFTIAGVVTDTVASGSYALVSADAVYNYAHIKSDTLATISVSGSGIGLGYGDGHTATVPGSVTTSISSGSGTALVTEGAVYNFASTASKINTTATNGNATYYITFVDGSGDGKTVYVDSTTSPLSYNPSTNTINANISGKAATAGTADKVAHSLTIAGLTYSGAADLNIQLSSGLQLVQPTAGVNLLAVKTSTNSGIGLDDSSGVYVKLVSAGGLSSSGSGIALSDTGIGTGTYSALQVDAKGRAVAGGQAVVFAENASDPDLQSLVVGGLAFIGTAATYTDSANTTHSIPTGTDPKIG